MEKRQEGSGWKNRLGKNRFQEKGFTLFWGQSDIPEKRWKVHFVVNRFMNTARVAAPHRTIKDLSHGIPGLGGESNGKIWL